METKKTVKVIVFHTYFGCESGCCGHKVKIDDDEFGFEFNHPYSEDFKEWAKEFAQNAVTKKYGARPRCQP